jgi:lipopolysaccharide transport protein LptA
MFPLGTFASSIQITSDALEIQTFGSHVQMHFFHNVRIGGDEFTLNGDHVQITLINGFQGVSNLSKVQEIHDTGNATFEQASYEGKAEQISIYPTKKFILLEGNAEIRDEGSGTMFGQTLILDLKNKQIKSKGSKFQRSIISIDDVSKFRQNNMLIK